MELSIVSSMYRSEDHLPDFIDRIIRCADSLSIDYEFILVNDGSPDDSLGVALAHRQRYPRVKVIDLSRNFGHHQAIMAGLGYCAGRYVFLIDCDLEEEPELLTDFYERITAQSHIDVFYGVQKKRKGGFVERVGGKLFYKLFNMLARLKLRESVLTVRIMTHRYVRALISYREKELFLAGIFEITGFNQEAIAVEKHHRKQSTYNFGRRLRLMVAGITSFSSFPLLISFYAGVIISFVSICYAAYLTIRKLTDPSLIIEGWTSLMVSVWFLGGVGLVSCGLLGLYLSRIYNEVKRRPNFIVRELFGFAESDNPNRGTRDKMNQ